MANILRLRSGNEKFLLDRSGAQFCLLAAIKGLLRLRPGSRLFCRHFRRIKADKGLFLQRLSRKVLIQRPGDLNPTPAFLSSSFSYII